MQWMDVTGTTALSGQWQC